MTDNKARLGEGVFLVADVAKILELPLPKVRFWLLEFWNKKFGLEHGKYSFGEDKNRAVNFLTLIEFIAFAKLREQGISAQRIQKFHKHLSGILDTKYPFAETKLLTDKKDLWYERYDEIVRHDGKSQMTLKKIVEPYLRKIEFDKNRIARRYFPLGKAKNVVIDPEHQFGQATIVGTNIKVKTIYALYEGDESIENICELYNLKESKSQMQ
ncbi:MAG: DUF433 domain-containing protein [Bacteroidetes bacterium]|nr:DUF433 domain-containing protein [Bacteroidota bacterium]